MTCIESKLPDMSEVVSWEDYFMLLACLASRRSKDPCRKVGACIVNQDRRIVALGYNGMPNGCDDKDMPWGKDGDWADTKYPYVCHAEMNAILNKTSADLKNCVMYVTKFPCNECAKLIVQSGITAVYYHNDIKDPDKREVVAAKFILQRANVTFSQQVSKVKVEIDLAQMQ
ncbi:hypothetical protein CHUAL_001036 [Chamberlinius hualienensis]